MRKRYFPIFISIIAIIGCLSPNNDSSENAILWEITGNNLLSPSYLLGTQHNISHRFLNEIPNYKSAISNANQIALEFDLEQFDNLLFQEVINEEKLFKNDNNKNLYFLPEGDKFEELFSTKEIERIKEYIKKKGLPEKIFTLNPKPIFLLNHFLQPSLPLINHTDSLMDRYLQYFAIKNNYNLFFLEDSTSFKNNIGTLKRKSAFLMENIYSQPIEIQRKILLHFIKNDSIKASYPIERDSLYKLQQISKAQDLEITYYKNYFPTKSEKEIKEILSEGNSYLLDERNNNWMQKIPNCIHEKPTLIAVGYSHLFGKKGLIQQLRNLGYTVTPISTSNNN